MDRHPPLTGNGRQDRVLYGEHKVQLRRQVVEVLEFRGQGEQTAV